MFTKNIIHSLIAVVLFLSVSACDTKEQIHHEYISKTSYFKECEFQWAISSHVIDKVNNVLFSEFSDPEKYIILIAGANRDGFKIQYYGASKKGGIFVSGTHITGDAEVKYQEVGRTMANNLFSKFENMTPLETNMKVGGYRHNDCAALSVRLNNKSYKLNYLNDGLMDRESENLDHRKHLKRLDATRLFFKEIMNKLG